MWIFVWRSGVPTFSHVGDRDVEGFTRLVGFRTVVQFKVHTSYFIVHHFLSSIITFKVHAYAWAFGVDFIVGIIFFLRSLHHSNVLLTSWLWYGMAWHGMVEVCEGVPVAVNGWVLTDPPTLNHIFHAKHYHLESEGRFFV